MALSQITFEFENEVLKKEEELKNFKESLLLPRPKRGRKTYQENKYQPELLTVPEDEILFQKQYYSTSCVAEMFKEKTSLIRYWENEFDILKPKKNKKGDRFFRPEDVKNLKIIYYLLRERKYSIEGAKDFFKKNKSSLEKYEMLESLQKIKFFLLELKNNL